ncbi:MULTISPECIES: hypothetical protein [unclassified Paenibacillus]|uniref:hypothetical protein n=1 Tax=unclassified Paenibacillus TaxID=185978 RepID=UPI001C124020|nr:MULTISPECIES: hypothetical protein [unclassified Paenibacillus]MBU5442951.1 hypothetical protein [Paenibacillus sp. MSJ-34]CAH0119501.1 hypothetical protein PAE9249_02005 [Paenibacillus sp. CECT 9249]
MKRIAAIMIATALSLSCAAVGFAEPVTHHKTHEKRHVKQHAKKHHVKPYSKHAKRIKMRAVETPGMPKSGLGGTSK